MAAITSLASNAATVTVCQTLVQPTVMVVEAGEDIEAGSENSGEDVLPKIGDIQSNPVNPCIFLQIYRDTTKKRL